MSNLKKLMAIAAILFATSSMLVACSDDDSSTLGPVSVNSVRVTSNSVTIIWSIVPNDKCGGYDVSLLRDSRDGAVVEAKNFDNRTCTYTFTNLEPNSRYVIKVQAVPGKGFSDAEIFYREFMTAPLVDGLTVTYSNYGSREVVSNGQTTTVSTCTATLTWDAISVDNCGGYNIALYEGTADNHLENPVANTRISDNTVSFPNLIVGNPYCIEGYIVGNTMCDFSTGDKSWFNFTPTPAQ